MDFTVTAKGKTFDVLTRDVNRKMRSATRTVGRDVATAGEQAIDRAAPRMMGRRLSAVSKVQTSATRSRVELLPAPGQSGAWSIAESGRRGGYTVRAGRGRALSVAGHYYSVVHPGRVAARHAWTRAVARAGDVMADTVTDTYAEALGAT